MQEFVADSSIFTVDALYFEAYLASIHLIQHRGKLALVDTGTHYSVPQVAAALKELGLNFDSVELIILTHIHLDHAGGCSALMKLCDNAQLVVHPKGARHMVNPEKLIAGTLAVYGKAQYHKLYGEITPVDASRIITPKDGEELNLAGRELHFIDSPGHANHHHCIIDKLTNSVFTGDTLGIAYQALRDPDHAFVMPTTTPVQFNPEALHQSIDKVMAVQPDWLYYTHYGALKPSSRIIAGLHEQIEDYVALTQQVSECLGSQPEVGKFEEKLSSVLCDYLVRRAQNELATVNEAVIRHWLKLDARLNAQGLAYWWNYRRTSRLNSSVES